MAHYVYRTQLASIHHGHALYEPAPDLSYDQVRVGDVGIVLQGRFVRMYNALLPADHPSQGYGVPLDFTPLDIGPFENIRSLTLPPADYCSGSVTAVKDRGIGEQIQAAYVIKSQTSQPFYLPTWIA
jgi:hypothetical protein